MRNLFDEIRFGGGESAKFVRTKGGCASQAFLHGGRRAVRCSPPFRANKSCRPPWILDAITHSRRPMLALVSLLFAAFVAISSPYAAEHPVLRGYITEALANNPALKTAEAERRAAGEKVRQAGSLPDPELSIGISVPPMERFMGDQVASVSLMQMLPAFGTRVAAKEEARAMTAMQGEVLRDTRDRITFEVKSAWYEFYAVTQDARAAEADLELLRALERIALERYGAGDAGSASPRQGMQGSGAGGASGASGASASASSGMAGMTGMGGAGGTPSGSPSAGGTSGSATGMGGSMGGGAMSSGSGMAELMRLRLDILEAEDALERRRADTRVAAMRLNRLLGRDAGDAIEAPDSMRMAEISPIQNISTDPEGLDNPDSPNNPDITDNHPMLRMLEEESRAGAAMEKMNRRMGLPMIGVGVQYDWLREREGGMGAAPGGNMLMPMVSVSLPIWRGKYSGAVREASLRREAVEAMRVDARADLRVQLEEARRDLDDARRRVALSAAREEVTVSLRDITAARQAAGEGSAEQLLEAERELMEARRRIARAVAEYNIAVARLERLTGGAR